MIHITDDHRTERRSVEISNRIDGTYANVAGSRWAAVVADPEWSKGGSCFGEHVEAGLPAADEASSQPENPEPYFRPLPTGKSHTP